MSEISNEKPIEDVFFRENFDWLGRRDDVGGWFVRFVTVGPKRKANGWF